MRAIFVGEVTRINDIKQVGQRNTAMLSFLAVDFSDSRPNQEKRKEWECTLWGRQAETATSLRVGGLFFIDGKLEEREYLNRDNQRRTAQSININEIAAIVTPEPRSNPRSEPSQPKTQTRMDFTEHDQEPTDEKPLPEKQASSPAAVEGEEDLDGLPF